MSTKQDTRDRLMFGCTLAELRSVNSCTNWDDPVDLNILAGSILSDAQEVLRGHVAGVGSVPQAERVRQYINRAKHCVFESTRIQREKERQEYQDRQTSAAAPSGKAT
jgi:hypothetical protein